MKTKSYFAKLCTCLSQLTNVALLNGLPDETISGRAYRKGVLENRPKWFVLHNFIDLVFFWQDSHCKKSHLYDKKYALLILSYYYDISKFKQHLRSND